MHRRLALQSILTGVISLAGCKCIVNKKLPAVLHYKRLPNDVYWDEVNKRWVSFKKIELSSKTNQVCCINGILFNLTSTHYCLAKSDKCKLHIPLTQEKHNKKYFFDSACKYITRDKLTQKYQGNFYEIINTDLNTTNLLYM